MPMSNALLPGTPVLVRTAGVLRRGLVLHVCADGFLAVRLDGERGVDEWHPALVVRA